MVYEYCILQIEQFKINIFLDFIRVFGWMDQEANTYLSGLLRQVFET